ncbi:S-layer homology domain-containing protein [Paenibacillus spongiae]|uniref:S-layer homology domain-containing protein n=1 Tax=Paenibacillus spongiae TaxID=2909671 RepID=A0ABY5SF03_9BACL|nr:S-layer homology domain-containing protein [Paenibacillus spongiae]UVI32234.1 S-layer homology domain-containing protein [Paenibacillus spongiae]
MRKRWFLSAVIMLLVLAVGQNAWAFPDTKNDPNEAKINELQKQGVIAGEKDGSFKPQDKLTYAAGVTMLVKGLGLNIDHIKFVKKPEASDSFTKVKDGAWYSDAFIVASLNNLDIDRDVDPAAFMTREQFAHHLFQGMMEKGDYAFIEIFMELKDEADVTPAYMDSIQKLLIAKIAELDKNGKFYPKTAIKRGEAASWLHDAIVFVKENALKPDQGTKPEPFPYTDLKLATKAVNEQIQEVTVTAMAPHPGYGLRIASITFVGDQAYIQVEAVHPDKDRMYPQVITEVKATTYVASAFKPVLQDAGTSSSSNGSGTNGSSAASPAVIETSAQAR